MSKSKSLNLGKSMDIIFIISSIIFNISVSILYIATKLGNTELLLVSSVIVILLIIPFTITLIGSIQNEEVRFYPNGDYWAGELYIDKLIFSIIPDATERTQALLDDIIDFIISLK